MGNFIVGSGLVSVLVWVTACGGVLGTDSDRLAVGGKSSNSADRGGATQDLTLPLPPVSGVGGSTGVDGQATSNWVKGEEFVPIPSTTLPSNVCSVTSTECEPVMVASQLVVDLGSSMGAVAPGNSLSNWETTRQLLLEFATNYRASLLGVSFYPNQSTVPELTQLRPVSSCINVADDIPMPLVYTSTGDPAIGQAMADTLMRVQVFPNAGAATLDAYRSAVAAAKARNSLPGIYAGINLPAGAIILVTDGHPTLSQGCLGTGSTPVDPEPIIQEIAAAKAAGIWTIVVGTPGSDLGNTYGPDARHWLSRAARAGGRPRFLCSDDGPVFCHLDMTQSSLKAADLSAQLAEPCGVSCRQEIGPPPENKVFDLAKTLVTYRNYSGNYLIQQNTAEPCLRGWHYVDNLTAVEICPLTCQEIATAAGGNISSIWGCQQVGTDGF